MAAAGSARDVLESSGAVPAIPPGIPAPCHVDGIRAVQVSPFHVRFQVQYWIGETVQGPFFVGARVDDDDNSGFSVRQAGREPDGVPRGRIEFTDDVAIEVWYQGARPRQSTSIELYIYDSAGTRMASATLPWVFTWAPKLAEAPGFRIGAVRPSAPPGSEVPSADVAFQVEYEIPPGDPRTFFLSGSVPGSEGDFDLVPAGLPRGVPKGACGFDPAVAIVLCYVGRGARTTDGLEVSICTTERTIVSERFEYVHRWERAEAARHAPGVNTPETPPSPA